MTSGGVAPIDVTGDLLRPRPRVVIRHRDDTGALTDVVGLRLDHGAAGWRVLPDGGPAVTVAARDVVAVREVPPKRVRPASSAADLERLTALGWPGTEQARLGGWLLRAGGGWTGRANSTLTVGDPGLGLDDALAVVRGWYRGRGLPARLHVPFALDGTPLPEPDRPGSLDVDLASRGWAAHDETLVLVADLRRARGPEPAKPAGVGIEWADAPTPRWLAVNRGGTTAADPAAARVLGAVPAHYLVLTRGGADVAVGRVVLTRDWCGIGGVEVVDSARRGGLGRLVTALLLHRSAAAGARFAYLQTLRSNTAALALYAGFGFTGHHAYHYRREPPGA